MLTYLSVREGLDYLFTAEEIGRDAYHQAYALFRKLLEADLAWRLEEKAAA